MSSADFDVVRDGPHLFSQRRVIAALLDTAGRSWWRNRTPHAAAAPLALPRPELTARVTSPSSALVRDYARYLGVPADLYRSTASVPGHLFTQWTFPLAARALREAPYPLTRILNAGCRLEMNASVPASSPLTVRASLVDIKDDGRRPLLHERVVTDTPSHPAALVADLYLVVAAPSREQNGRDRQPPAAPPDAGRVPADAREMARFHFGPRAGLGFAFLTGDFNPIHWAPAYARAAGFATPILHGVALLARTLEGLGRALFAGAVDRIRVIDVKFKRPLVLGDGADVGLYLDDANPRAFYLAQAPGVRPYLVGSFETHGPGARHA